MGLGIFISIISDTHLSSENLWRLFPGYGALALHALSSLALDHTLGVLSPSLGSTFSLAASTLGACIFSLPFYVFQSFVVCFEKLYPGARLSLAFQLQHSPTPVLPLSSLAALPFIAYALLFRSPMTARSLSHLSFGPQHFMVAFPVTAVLSAMFGTLAFTEFPTWSDLFVGGFLYHGITPAFVPLGMSSKEMCRHVSPNH